MDKPLFSVIVPTLNEERILPNLLNSLSNQSFKNFELIVVDGNSQDKTRDVFKRDVFVKLGGFDQEVVFAEDVELAQRCAKNGLRGRVFFSPFHCLSFRRIERDGWLMQVKKLLVSYWHISHNGPIKEPLFDYRMGGYVDKN